MNKRTKVKIINWIDNYRGFIGHLSDADAQNWKTVIKSNLNGVTTAEVDDAMAMLCTRKLEDPSIKVTAKSIIDQIRVNRYTERNGHEPTLAYCTVMMDNHWMRVELADLKQRLSKETSPDEAWNIICSPLETDACKILHSFADSHQILYNVFKPPPHESVQGLLGKVLRRPPR